MKRFFDFSKRLFAAENRSAGRGRTSFGSPATRCLRLEELEDRRLLASLGVVAAPASATASPGDTCSFAANFRASESGNSSTLQLKVYFSSSLIEKYSTTDADIRTSYRDWSGVTLGDDIEDSFIPTLSVTNVFATNRYGATVLHKDTTNGDSDSRTDMYISFLWNSSSTNWTGISSLPTSNLKLFDVSLTVMTDSYSGDIVFNFVGDQYVGNWTWTSSSYLVTVDGSAPLAAPALSAATANSWSRVELQWGSVENAYGYEIRYSNERADLNEGGNPTVCSPIIGGRTTSSIVTGLEGDTTYYFQVRTLGSASGAGNSIGWSSVKSATTFSEAPTEVNVTFATERIYSDTLAGTPVATLTTVDPNTNDSFTYTIVSQKNTQNVSVTYFSIVSNQVRLSAAAAAGVYTLTVRSTDKKGNSVESAPFNLTVLQPPIASISSKQTQIQNNRICVYAGTSFLLSAENSSSVYGLAEETPFAWDFNRDGKSDATAKKLWINTLQLGTPQYDGTYSIKLTVKDAYGKTVSTTLTVEVIETPIIAVVKTDLYVGDPILRLKIDCQTSDGSAITKWVVRWGDESEGDEGETVNSLSNALLISHCYNATSTYTPSVEVTSITGKTSTLNLGMHTITIEQPALLPPAKTVSAALNTAADVAVLNGEAAADVAVFNGEAAADVAVLNGEAAAALPNDSAGEYETKSAPMAVRRKVFTDAVLAQTPEEPILPPLEAMAVDDEADWFYVVDEETPLAKESTFFDALSDDWSDLF